MNKPSTKQNGFAILHILLVLVVLTIVGGVGWYVYNTQKNADKTTGNTGSSSAIISSTPTPTETDNAKADITEDWLTVSSQSGLYLIKYPKEWAVRRNADNSIGLVKATETNTFNYVFNVSDASMANTDKPANVSFEDYVTTNNIAGSGSGSAKIVDSQRVQTASGPIYLVKLTDAWFGGEKTLYNGFFDLGNGKFLLFQNNADDNSDEYIVLYKKVLSTFKLN